MDQDKYPYQFIDIIQLVYPKAVLTAIIVIFKGKKTAKA
jgi:hypothetical protein